MSQFRYFLSRLFVLRAVGCYETVSSSRMEQRINLKFLVKLRKTPTECFKLLKEVYGEDVMSRMQIFEWHKRFEKGCEDVEDDPKTGRSSTTRTDENIIRVKQLVRSHRRLTARMISDELSLNRESVWTILLHNLGMRKMCAKMLPKILSEDQKQNRVKFYEDILEKIKENPDILRKIITGDETWFSNTILKQRGKACSGRLQNYLDPRRRATESNEIVTKATNTMLHKSLKHKNGMTYVKEIATQ